MHDELRLVNVEGSRLLAEVPQHGHTLRPPDFIKHLEILKKEPQQLSSQS